MLDITFARSYGAQGMIEALDRVSQEALKAIEAGCKLVVLSDRAINEDRVPIPAALSVGAVHQFLLKKRRRLQV